MILQLKYPSRSPADAFCAAIMTVDVVVLFIHHPFPLQRVNVLPVFGVKLTVLSLEGETYLLMYGLYAIPLFQFSFFQA